MTNKLNFEKPIIMGILNVTPDSFSDGGSYPSTQSAVDKALIMIKQGAKIIDIGGESTRPGSERVSPLEQKRRIIDVISQLKKVISNDILISVDTTSSEVAEAAIDLKVDMINDISGGTDDEDLISLVASHDLYYCIMHKKGEPKTMQDNPSYVDVLKEVKEFLLEQAIKAEQYGISKNKIILDPGIGFGKNLKHNITLISNISIFHSLGFPIMLGISRKKFIKDLSGNNESKERLGGTISSSLHAVTQGVQILRVHDVNEISQSLKVFKSIKYK